MEAWSPFFQVQAGASASLIGLVFIGLSISFDKIIRSPHLPNRALEALVTLFLNLATATLFLVPGQTPVELALEVLTIACVAWAATSYLHVHSYRRIEREFLRRSLLGTALGQVTFVCWLAGTSAMLRDGLAGMPFIVPGFLLGYLLALLNAWVLLVEINR